MTILNDIGLYKKNISHPFTMSAKNSASKLTGSLGNSTKKQKHVVISIEQNISIIKKKSEKGEPRNRQLRF